MDVVRALAGLGDTPGAVAASLAALGCRGRRGCASGCPVWAYLAGRFPGQRFGVLGTEVLVEHPHGFPVRAFLPGAVAGFVRAFDGGGWPALRAG